MINVQFSSEVMAVEFITFVCFFQRCDVRLVNFRFDVFLHNRLVLSLYRRVNFRFDVFLHIRGVRCFRRGSNIWLKSFLHNRAVLSFHWGEACAGFLDFHIVFGFQIGDLGTFRFLLGVQVLRGL